MDSSAHETCFTYRQVEESRKRNAMPKECCFSFRIQAPSTCKGGIKSKKTSFQKSKKKILVPTATIISAMIYSPSVAADRIGISVSTLRRRFAEFECSGGWPITEMEFAEQACKQKAQRSKSSIKEITNNENTRNCKSLDTFTTTILQCAFKQHLV